MEAALTTRGDAIQPDGEADALAELVARAARGEERAWEELVRLYAGRVFALAQSRLRRPDLAEEITQSVFVTVAVKLRDQEYREVGRFEPWLFRVTMNRVRDAARSMKRRATPMEPGLIARIDTPAPAQSPAAEEADLRSLRDVLETLNHADREVIELRHHGRMNFKDIADLLGEPVGTVLARHHRALRKLRTALEARQEEA
jgi:RNA polymerase sigma-70 factor (ECF subfamily)